MLYEVFNIDFMQQMVLRQNKITEIFKKSLLFMKNFNHYLLRLMVINLGLTPVVLFWFRWIFITQHAALTLFSLRHCTQHIYMLEGNALVQLNLPLDRAVLLVHC